ncbi:MAG: UDP-N-acetylmuramate dehydrogenase [Candidatus Hydrogenedentes bacterium]|nr:UDP-N-acetylmuramate dehydrogenase [Candidatus Hydrogenedentota bacterium]
MGSLSETYRRSIARIANAAGGISLFDEPMARHTTWQIGGPADLWIVPDSVDGVLNVISICNETDVPWTVIGHGSNVLVSDDGYRGVVINIEAAANALDVEGATVEIGGGRPLSELDRIALETNLSGPDNWVGIPGTVGGAVAGNAGAFGAAVCSFISALHLARPDGDGWVSMSEIPHHYRHCHLLPDTIVLAARFSFVPEANETIRARRRVCAEQRTESQPTGVACAGSVFRNPPDRSAGSLIDETGMKGFRLGGAVISEKHANFIVNTGGATAQDVARIIDETRRRVNDATGIWLEPEVRFVGRFDIDTDTETFRI